VSLLLERVGGVGLAEHGEFFRDDLPFLAAPFDSTSLPCTATDAPCWPWRLRVVGSVASTMIWRPLRQEPSLSSMKRRPRVARVRTQLGGGWRRPGGGAKGVFDEGALHGMFVTTLYGYHGAEA